MLSYFHVKMSELATAPSSALQSSVQGLGRLKIRMSLVSTLCFKLRTVFLVQHFGFDTMLKDDGSAAIDVAVC